MIATALISLLTMQETFAVSGTVVHSATGAPLSNARVILAPFGRSDQSRVEATGPRGSFRFDGVAAGKYNLMAFRDEFVPRGYFARSIDQTNLSGIFAGKGRQSENLIIQMVPGAAITGVVTDTSGNPVRGMTVFAFRVVGFGANRQTYSTARAYTDDQGAYRVHSLTAGDYALLCAGMPPGREAPDKKTAYSATYFPGTTQVEGAETLRLDQGREYRTDFRLNPVSPVTARGRVLAKDVASIWLSIPTPFRNSPPFGDRIPVAGGAVRIENIPPGRYVVSQYTAAVELARQKTVDFSGPEATFTLDDVPMARVEAKIEIRGRPPRAPGMLRLYSVRAAGAEGSIDPDGSARIPEVRAGLYQVSVRYDRPLATIGVHSDALQDGWLRVPETGVVVMTVVADASAVRLRGRVLLGGEPQSGILVLLIPRDRLDAVGYHSFVTSEDEGMFTWPAVVPGEYLMTALESGGLAEDYFNPETLRTRLSKATPITVTGAPDQIATIEMKH